MSTEHGPVIQKSIPDMALYLKRLLPQDIPNTYKIHPAINEIAQADVIRNGIKAYKDYLDKFFDLLVLEGENHFKLKSKPKTMTDYPFLFALTDLLADIGYYSQTADIGKSWTLKTLPSFSATLDDNGRKKKPKNSASMLISCLRFLKQTGFVFRGIDLEKGKLNMNEVIGTIVTYPQAPDLLIGLKALAIADIKLREKRYKNDFNHDNLLRCDYRLISDEPLDTTSLLKDYLRPLSKHVQKYMLELHHHFTGEGLVCQSMITPFEIHFTYTVSGASSKKKSARDLYQKRLWSFSISPRHGYGLAVRAKKTDQNPDLIESLPEPLKSKILKGYGCDRKLRNEPCQGGCEGIRFPLDDSILDIGDAIKRWLDSEVPSRLK